MIRRSSQNREQRHHRHDDKIVTKGCGLRRSSQTIEQQHYRHHDRIMTKGKGLQLAQFKNRAKLTLQYSTYNLFWSGPNIIHNYRIWIQLSTQSVLLKSKIVN